MRVYETMFIVKPTLTAEEVASKVELIKHTITKQNGEICAFDDIGIKKLAYPIEKQSRGYYYVLYFKADGKAILELERVFKVTEDIIRHIVVKYDRKVEVKAWQTMVDRATKPSKES